MCLSVRLQKYVFNDDKNGRCLEDKCIIAHRFFLSHIGFVFNDVCLCVSKCHSVCACLVTSMLLHVSIFMYFGVLFFSSLTYRT